MKRQRSRRLLDLPTLKMPLISCLAGAAILSARPSLAIVGGELVAPGDPVAASTVFIFGMMPMMGREEFKFQCTGVLIRPNVVLTAAHCYQSANGLKTRFSRLHVAFGPNAPQKPVGESVRGVIDAEIPGDWNYRANLRPGLSDLAIFRLDADAPSGFVPAALADANPELAPGSLIGVAGFGIVAAWDSRAMRTAGILRKTQSPFLSYEADGKSMTLDERDGHGTCDVDSGGPAFQIANDRMQLLGITSGGDDQCAASQYFVSVAAFRDFIEATIAKWQPAPAEQMPAPPAP
jgi:secreted trypsin-like serine protease